jgi:3-mercaptopyruvate sulfurtransferase SseA
MQFVWMAKVVFALVSAIWLWQAAGCQGEPSDKQLSFVNAADASQLVQGKKGLLGIGNASGVWVDARSESDYRAGHIPGAINLPYERVNNDHRILKDFGVLIVYGNDYNDSRALGMSKRLMALGYGDVRTLTGGMREWKAAGNPVETGPPSSPSAP